MSIKFVIPVIATALIGGTATQVMSGNDAVIPESDQAQTAPVALYDPANVVVTHTETVTRDYKVGATVIPRRQVTLSAQISGSIREIAGRVGDKTAANQLLVGINRDAMLAKRRAAISAYWQAVSQARNAQMQYQRQLHLARNGESSKSPGGFMPFGMDRTFNQFMGGGPSQMKRGAEVVAAQTAVAQAQNAIHAARSRIEGIDAALANSDSRAPFDGVIFKRLVEQGDTVQRGQPLLVVADTTHLQVEVDVPENLARSLRAGSPLEVNLESSKEPVMATVAQIFPMADRVRHTVKVKIDLPEDAPASAGMYAVVSVPEGDSALAGTFPVVPDSALTYRGGLPMVYVVGENGGPSLRLVRLGDKTDSGISVVSGLRSGERVVVDSVRYTAGL